MKAVSFAFAAPFRCKVAGPQPFRMVGHTKDLCADRPCLWIDTGTTVLDLGDGGLIIGILFSRTSSTRIECLPPDAPDCTQTVQLANWLVRNCWGAYVAILRNLQAGCIQILVDPSGLLPAYGFKTRSHDLVVSRPELIEHSSGSRPHPSLPEVHAHLTRPELRQRSTCLDQVCEFGRGELTVMGDTNSVAKALWSPEMFMPSGNARTCSEVAEDLKTVTTMVVNAWANVLGPVAVAASGGVDSSMLCAALAQKRQRFGCITLATRDPSGDESAYVALLGRHFGVPLKVRIYDAKHIDPLQSVSASLARPTRKPFMAALDTALFDAGESLGAKVIFDGNGGDSLFCFLHSAVPIVDRLLSEGPGRGAATTFIDMCRLTGSNMPHMVRAVIRRLSRGRGKHKWPPDLRLLNESKTDSPGFDPLSPWLDISTGRQWGKNDHLALIMRNQNRLNGLASLPRFSPLMSQPLVEYCLGVPTWTWCAGGINRAPARAAFASVLPRDILVRTSKAGPDSFLWQFFEKYRPIYRELLLDGQLMQHGLLDRNAVEQAVMVDSTSANEIIYRVFDLIEAENWVRSWQL